MDLKNIIGNVARSFKTNSPVILTALGVSGVVSTAYLTGKASYKASEIINEHESLNGVQNEKLDRFKERAKLTWKLYIPAGLCGTVTVGCIVGAGRVHGSRTAAAVTAYSLTEKAFGEYREKVIEQVGKTKEEKIRAEIAQDRVNANPPNEINEVVVINGGHVLVCELYTGRFFRSEMETIRKCVNDINYVINQQTYVTLNEFYDMLGLPYTQVSDYMGWDTDKLMEVNFTTVLSPNGEPCLAFTYGDGLKIIHSR